MDEDDIDTMFIEEDEQSIVDYLQQQTVDEPSNEPPLKKAKLHNESGNSKTVEIETLFTSEDEQTLLDYLKEQRSEEVQECYICKTKFPRKRYLQRHLTKHYSDKFTECLYCRKPFSKDETLKRHIRNHHADRTHEDTVNDLVTRKGDGVNPDNDIANYNTEKNVDELFNVDVVTNKYSKLFNATATYYNIKLNDLNVTDYAEILEIIHKLFEHILKRVLVGVRHRDIDTDSDGFSRIRQGHYHNTQASRATECG